MTQACTRALSRSPSLGASATRCSSPTTTNRRDDDRLTDRRQRRHRFAGGRLGMVVGHRQHDNIDASFDNNDDDDNRRRQPTTTTDGATPGG
ncbi:hypothetical protein ACMYSQ_003152 [Aspergillus niger]